MGLLIIIGMFAIRGFEYPSWYSIGGYKIANADIEKSIGHKNIAEAYWRNGNVYAYRNHKSHYNLGMLLQKDKPSEAIQQFEWALVQKPTAQAVINKANLENTRQNYYGALFTLQEGNKLIPNNSQILNNLARQFETVKIIDSVRYYLASAGPDNPQVKNNWIHKVS